MIKKIGIVFSIIALAFFAFLYLQKGQVEQQVQTWLKDNQIEVQDFSVELFPQPVVVFQAVQAQLNQKPFSAEKVRLEFAWFSTDGGILPFNTVDVYNAEFASWQHINTRLTPLHLSLGDLSELIDYSPDSLIFTKALWDMNLQFSAQTPQSQQLNLKGKFSLNQQEIVFSRLSGDIVFADKSPLNIDKFSFSWGKGRFSWANHQYQLIADGVQINQQIWGYLKAFFSLPSKTQPNLTAFFDFPHQSIQMKLRYSPQEQQGWLEGKQLEAETLLKTFHLPTLLSGMTEIKMQFQLQPFQSDLQLSLQDGVLNGIDVLRILSQYVPLNINEQGLSTTKTATSFERLGLQGLWSAKGLQLQQLNLQTPNFIAQAQGEMDFSNRRCSFTANIAVINAKYADFALPIRFFGDCHSLQYKVEMNRQFRQQLKNFIRDKLK
ncbi:MAG: hypothetical protein Q4B95_03640 [Lonepinella koalarum]|nr:hypothetical protein [Lonepinella koalarum]